MTATWLDAAAGDLAWADGRMRQALRALAHGAPSPAHHHPAAPGRILATPFELRSLLRGVMPAAVATTPRRLQHARLAVAMQLLAAQLLGLAIDHPARTEAAIAAALDVATQAREWARRAAWQQATRSAGVQGWACPAPITRITRLATAEQIANAPTAPALRAGSAGTMDLLAQLSLPLDPPADPRQAVLRFAQHGHQVHQVAA